MQKVGVPLRKILEIVDTAWHICDLDGIYDPLEGF